MTSKVKTAIRLNSVLAGEFCTCQSRAILTQYQMFCFQSYWNHLTLKWWKDCQSLLQISVKAWAELFYLLGQKGHRKGPQEVETHAAYWWLHCWFLMWSLNMVLFIISELIFSSDTFSVTETLAGGEARVLNEQRGALCQPQWCRTPQRCP